MVYVGGLSDGCTNTSCEDFDNFEYSVETLEAVRDSIANFDLLGRLRADPVYLDMARFTGLCCKGARLGLARAPKPCVYPDAFLTHAPMLTLE